MLLDDIKPNIPNEKDKQVVDDLMDELENLGAKVKSTKHDDDDEDRKKKKHHRHRSPDSKYDRKKSRYPILTNPSSLRNLPSIISHKDRKRRRHSSTGSNSSNRSGSSDSDRSSSPKHHRSSKKSKHHDRNESPPGRKGKSSVPDKPMVGSIYDGTIISIMQWGCFVRLDQFRNRTEGLVHISNVRIDLISFRNILIYII
jgi:hypothetical protein